MTQTTQQILRDYVSRIITQFSLALSLLLTLVSFRCFFLFLSSSLPHAREVHKMLSFLLSLFLYVDTFRKTLTNRSPQAFRSAILNSKPHLRHSVSYSFFFFFFGSHAQGTRQLLRAQDGIKLNSSSLVRAP